ncbi:MAG: cysteine hydrolase family protein [Oscillospiraceae bacterium]
MWKSRARPRGQPAASRSRRTAPRTCRTRFRLRFTVLPQDYVLVKPRFSAFFHTELDLILRRLGVQTVLLAGTTTPNCIRTTCYDAISLDYDAVVLSDCTSSVTDAVQAANLADMQRVGAVVCASTELPLAESSDR